MSLATPVLRVRLSRDDLLMRAGVALLAIVLLLIVGLPLWSLLVKGFEDRDGKFVGIANYLAYFSTPALFNSALNSFHVAAVCTAIVVPLAFLYAYALTRAVLLILYGPFEIATAEVKVMRSIWHATFRRQVGRNR